MGSAGNKVIVDVYVSGVKACRYGRGSSKCVGRWDGIGLFKSEILEVWGFRRDENGRNEPMDLKILVGLGTGLLGRSVDLSNNASKSSEFCAMGARRFPES